MSDPTITAFLTQLLCSHGGRIPRDLLSGLLELSPEQIEEILNDEPQKFPLVGDLVLARNPVRICPKYLKDEAEEEECDKLHLCRLYLQDKCRSRQCRFSHDLSSSHNQSILKAQEISGLDEKEVKVLLYQNDNQMLPEVCVKYLHDTCDLGVDCSRLHVCGFFTRGECTRRYCKRSHHLLESGSALSLARCGISDISVQNFQMLCVVKHIERLQSLSDPGKKGEEKGNAATRRSRGRGRGRHGNKKKGESQNEARSKSRGRQGDRAGAGSNFRGRSSSRPMSENGERYFNWSEDHDDEDEPQKTRADKIMEDWFSPPPARSDDRGASSRYTAAMTPPIVQPLMSLTIDHPTPSVTTTPPAPPQVSSSQPGISAGLLTPTSTSSAPQPKPATTPVTPTRPVNTPAKPVNLPTKDPSVVEFNKPVPPSAVKPPSVTPVTPTRPSRIVDSSMKGPSVPPEKPVTTPITGPSIPQPLVPNIPLIYPAPGPFIAPAPHYYASVTPPAKGHLGFTTMRPVNPTGSPSILPTPYYQTMGNVPMIPPYVLVNKPVMSTMKPVTAPVARPFTPPPVSTMKPVTAPVARPFTPPPVSTMKPVTAPIASPFTPPPVSTMKPVTTPVVNPFVPTPLVNAPMNRPFVPLDKPVTASVASPFTPPPVSTMKPVTTSVASPSIPQPASTMKPVTTPITGPSTAPSPSYSRLATSPTEGPPVLHVKPVQSFVRYQPVSDDKPISRAGDREDLGTTKPTFSAPQTSLKKVEPDKVPEICLPNLWKYCKLGGRCPDMHYYLPYRWQIYRGTDWEDVPNMEEIEKCYCDPKIDRVPLIDFLTMRSGGLRVRRLSTVSSVVKPSEYVLTTEWLWYWKDEYGTWTQYGHSNVKQVSSSILSSALENVYLSDPVAVSPFTAGHQTYEINFREMKQKNVLYKTEKIVRRRPKFLSFEDVKTLRGSTRSAAAKSPLKSGTSTLNTDIFPKTWDPESMPEIGCQKVLVSETSPEFSEIVSSFSKTVSGHEVKKMWRLQNPSLWQVFQWQKEQMKKVNQGRDVKEIRSFHGTERTHIDAICNHNFDWRICGTHGTVYGQGSYFARDASYSHNYSTPTPGGSRAMFVARVLVGDYITGAPHMKRPPLRPGSSSRYYDSCVDDTADPAIYVVFEKHQIYPEYLLEYQEEQKRSCVVC